MQEATIYRVQIGASVRLEICSQEVPDTETDRQTHTHTDTQTNCSKNKTPPRFRGGVKSKIGGVLVKRPLRIMKTFFDEFDIYHN